MTVYGVDSIDAAIAAAAGGSAVLNVGRRDVVTPLARDHALENNVEIVVSESARSVTGSEPRPAALSLTASPPPAQISPSPALYRRGAPLAARFLPRSRQKVASSPAGRFDSPSRSRRVPRVVVVGSGRVGMIAAMRLAESDLIDEVVLVDVADGLAAGTALDISHSAGLLGFSTALRGEVTVEAAGPADFTVITAGRARQPGMSRSDLTEVNAAIVGGLARSVARVSPAGVIVVVTNPLDEMTAHVWKMSELPSSRVIGMAGVLDTARFTSLLGGTGLAKPSQIEGMALGSHGEEMFIPRSLMSANGKPVTGQIDNEALEAVVARTRDSGAEVVALLKTGSAFITPGLAAARMVITMILDDDRVIAATVRPSGEYGIDGTYVGLPVRLGRNGLKSIAMLDLDPTEQRALTQAAARIAERVASAPKIVVHA
ncbi:MAG: malate dehydrogenase [Subtercola sp.]|nr:malate dehydrogenase [Subtercola sp.]